MACETIPKEINGDTWTVTQMAASQALALEAKLAPVLLQALVPIISASGDTEQEQGELLSRAVREMMAAIPADELVAIIKDLCSQCFKNGERVVFERDFSGGAGVMLRYRVAWFVLEANFSDFFGEILPDGVLDRAKSMFEEKTAQVESIGDSGDPVSRSLHSAA